MTYGIYDPVDHIWYGSDNGAALFEDKSLAMLARSVVILRTGLPGTRVQVTPYDDTPLQKKDEIATPMTTIQALKWLEGDL